MKAKLKKNRCCGAGCKNRGIKSKKISEAIFSSHTPSIDLEYLISLADKVSKKGVKRLRCIEIVPGKDKVEMQLLNIIGVECSISIGNPRLPKGAVTRVAINVTDDESFECKTIERFCEIIDVLKEKVDEQNRKNVVVTINFKSSLDPKKSHEKQYKNTRYFFDDELDIFYFAVGYPTTAYIKNFVNNNPDLATSDELVTYSIPKNSVEKDTMAEL